MKKKYDLRRFPPRCVRAHWKRQDWARWSRERANTKVRHCELNDMHIINFRILVSFRVRVVFILFSLQFLTIPISRCTFWCSYIECFEPHAFCSVIHYQLLQDDKYACNVCSISVFGDLDARTAAASHKVVMHWSITDNRIFPAKKILKKKKNKKMCLVGCCGCDCRCSFVRIISFVRLSAHLLFAYLFSFTWISLPLYVRNLFRLLRDSSGPNSVAHHAHCKLCAWVQ